jgi:alpha-L-rhamnosidase
LLHRHSGSRLPSRSQRGNDFNPQPGRFIFDLGQNIVGWPIIQIPTRKDQLVTLRFAEMLEKDGTLYTASYRSAKSTNTNTYTAATDGTATRNPTFTFHGFRYVELSGFPAGTRPDRNWVTGAVLHSDFGWNGTFTSSHQMRNQLQSNIIWGLRGNFLDIPTDCPQRDERLGWTGDAQVSTPAAIFNADVHSFLASWLESMRLDQQPDGAIPAIVPDVEGINGNRCGGPGWSDAATVTPWEIYIRTGDLTILEENFDMMNRWVAWRRK